MTAGPIPSANCFQSILDIAILSVSFQPLEEEIAVPVDDLLRGVNFLPCAIESARVHTFWLAFRYTDSVGARD